MIQDNILHSHQILRLLPEPIGVSRSDHVTHDVDISDMMYLVVRYVETWWLGDVT